MALIKPISLASHAGPIEDDVQQRQVELEIRKKLEHVADYAYTHGADDVEKLIRDFAEQFGEEA